MRKTDPNPPCPACGLAPQQGLSAPGISRGATPSTRMAVPASKTAAIDMAQRIIAEDSHVTNMNTNQREGDSAAIQVRPVKEPVWHSVPNAADIAKSASIKNSDFVSRLADRRQSHMAPVYREQKK